MALAAVAFDTSDDHERRESVLRQRLHEAVTDRDRAVTRAEQAEQARDVLARTHRHALHLRCDTPGCGEVMSVTMSHSGPDGAHAFALVTAALALLWFVGSRTQGAVAQLGRDHLMQRSARETDHCPTHAKDQA